MSPPDGQAAAPAGPLLPRIRAYLPLISIAAAVLVVDQATKAWVAALLPYPTYGENAGAVAVVRGFLYIVHVGNTGAAWSVFTGRSALLAVLAGTTLLAIFLGRRALALRTPLNQVCFGLLCGGIVGNLADRLSRGHVVDFLDFHFGSYVYPTFNVADSGICVGVIVYLIASMRKPAGAGKE